MTDQSLHGNREERWAFSAADLASPSTCAADDRLFARIRVTDLDGHIVDVETAWYNRRGELLNARELSEDAQSLAASEESFGHGPPEISHDDETAEWRDVIVDDEGRFDRFA